MNLINKISPLIVGLSRVLANGVTVIYTIIFLRFGGVSTQDYGQAIFVMYVLGFLAILTDLGMTEGIQKFVNRQDPRSIIGPALRLEFILVVVFAIIITVFDQGYLTRDHKLLFFLATICSTYNVVVLIFNGLHQHLKSALYQIIFVLLMVGTSSALYFIAGFELLTALLSAAIVSWGIPLLIMLADLAKQRLLDFRLPINKQFLRFSLNNFIYICSFLVLTQVDVLFINYFLGDSDSGIYKSTAQIALLTRIVGLAISTPLLPIFSSLFHQQKTARLNRLLGFSLVGVTGFVLVFVIFSFYFASYLLGLFFDNPELSQVGASILPVLAMAYGIQNLLVPVVVYFQATDREKALRNVSVVQAVLYAILMVSLVKLGISAAAYILLSVEVLALLAYLTIFLVSSRFWKTRKVEF
jgi:O-antigen/teichoic acid export membrane protein